MNIKSPEFFLPETAGLSGIERFSEFACRLDKIARNAGVESRWFKQRMEEFLAKADAGARANQLYDVRRDARVMLQLWLINHHWHKNVPLENTIVDFLQQQLGGFSGSNFYTLAEIYFLWYETVPDSAYLGNVISTSLGSTPASRLISDFAKQKRYRKIIFSSDAPMLVARKLKRGKRGFAEGLKALGVNPGRGGEYLESCRCAYFVEVCKGLDPGDSHTVLKELQELSIKKGRYNNQFNLGQAVCTELIKKCVSLPKGMPANWLKLVVNVLGDPRRPKKSRAYQEWWSAMDTKHEVAIKTWMAGVDLKLFLSVLKDCTKSEKVKRMYPARKAFLEGLLKHHSIKDARLFLSREAATAIRQDLGENALQAHGFLNDKHESVIYLKVGETHFFEGTHDYAARLSTFLPEDHPVLSREKSNFSKHALTTGLEAHFNKATGQDDGWFSVRHHPPLGWQQQLIDAFSQLEIEISPQQVLTHNDYFAYRKRYGL